jgi:hypothetical protein
MQEIMKKSNFKYFLIATVVVLGIVAGTVYSCEKQQFVPNTTEAISDDPTRFVTEPGAICGKMVEKSVVRADGRAIGRALIYNDIKYFYVILTANRGYLLGNAYMHIGSAMKEIPADGEGNAILQNYEYTIDAEPSSTFRKFRIPIKDISGNNFISVAVESSKSTAPSEKPVIVCIDGQFMGNDQKGRTFTYTKQICKTDNAQSNNEVE